MTLTRVPRIHEAHLLHTYKPMSSISGLPGQVRPSTVVSGYS